MRTSLLIIDPQIDFCDPNHGTLYVNGAEKDMARLMQMVYRLLPKLDSIHVTLDNHHYLDIAHPVFWQDAVGHHPDPFTPISVADVESRKWSPCDPDGYSRALAYVRALESQGRYGLFIWPYHCLIGSTGAAVMPDLFAALTVWEGQGRLVDYVPKGSNIWTEHYSAIQAEVPDPQDPSTQRNTALIARLREADRVLVAGEAGSHCLANTVRDLADSLDDDRLLERFVLLTDATSPVTGFEAHQEQFVLEMTARGMHLATSLEINPETFVR